MARIVIDARESGTSTGRYVDKLVEHLHKLKSGHEFILLVKPHRLDYMHRIAPKFKAVECKHKEFTFAEQIGLLKQINSLGPDLIHFVMVQQPILYRGKVITTMNDLTTTRFRNPDKNWLKYTVLVTVYKWVNKLVARKSNEILTYTDFVKYDVAKFAHINSRKITTIYLAADKIDATAMPIDELKDKQFIVYVGQPGAHKNLPRLIDAFEILRQKNPALWLVLAGKKHASYKRLEKDVQRRGLQHVMFTGFVEEGELRWLYENTKAYVMPSLSEGFGLPGLEAMLAGAPVVSSNATCLPEVYKDGAVYFDPENIEDMASAINKVLADEKLRKSLIARGKVVASKYDWQKTAEQTLEAYNRVLG